VLLLMFLFFTARSPSSLSRSPWNFSTRWEVRSIL